MSDPNIDGTNANAGEGPHGTLQQVKIWDRPVRFFHWALVISFAFAFYSGEFMSFDNVIWHKRIGYFIGSIVLFRFIWGFVGSQPARFASFVPTPKKTLNYVTGMAARKPSGTAGHNPIGGASVLAMLGLLSAQVGSGLFIYSDTFFEGGPLSSFASSAAQGTAAQIHHYCSKALLAFIVIHIGAIIFYYFWKKENLVKPMFTGLKWIRNNEQER